jgi:hypothetical protein
VSVQPDRCPRCGNTQISYGGGHAAFCGDCGLIADQDAFEVSEEQMITDEMVADIADAAREGAPATGAMNWSACGHRRTL